MHKRYPAAPVDVLTPYRFSDVDDLVRNTIGAAHHRKTASGTYRAVGSLLVAALRI